MVASFLVPSFDCVNIEFRSISCNEALEYRVCAQREFRLTERARLRPTIELDNVLNKTVYTFGAEFINFDALRPGATDEQRRAFADTFLVPTRTLRPRTIRVGLRIDF
jgi:hypothetical protein